MELDLGNYICISIIDMNNLLNKIFSTNCSLNKVNFTTQPCQVLDCSNTWIQCQTSSAYLVYSIDNSAADPCI